MNLTCESCGGKNSLPKGKSEMFCSFCGGHIEISQKRESVKVTQLRKGTDKEIILEYIRSGSKGKLELPMADLEGIHLKNANLIGANLSGANLINSVLCGANLTGANLTEANLMNCDLGGAILQRVNLNKALIMQSNFDEADLSETDLSGVEAGNLPKSSKVKDSEKAKLNCAKFIGANLTNANLTNANFSFVDLSKANLTGIKIRGTNFQESSLSLKNSVDFLNMFSSDSNRRGIRIYNTNLQNADFKNLKLESISFVNVNMQNADFKNLKLEYVSFYNVNLDGADLSHSSLKYGEMSNCSIKNIKLKDFIFHRSFRFCDLTFEGLDNCIFKYDEPIEEGFDRLHFISFNRVKFKNTKLSNRRLIFNAYDCHFENIDFSHSNLKASDFYDSKFKDCDFRNSKFDCGDFHNCNMENVKGLKSGCYLTTSCVEAMNLSDDCYELQTLRKFRDEYLAQTPNGRSMIEEYYETAPEIVDAINAAGNGNEIFKELYSDITEIVSLIEKGESEEAVSAYRNLTLSLKNKYLN